MRTLKGKWYWDEPITYFGKETITIDQHITFTSNGQEWFGIQVQHCYEPDAPEEYQKSTVTFYGYDIDPSEEVEVGYGMPQYGAGEMNKWNDDFPKPSDIYRTIDFGAEPQEVSEEFYNFFISSARLIPQNIAEKLQVIAENEQRVFDAGKKTEWDNFWDAYQYNGKRIGYFCAFSGIGWNDKTFKPKYNMAVKGSALEMFMYCEVTDIVKSLNECGVTLDFSNADSCKNLFVYSKTKALPVLNFSKSNNAEQFVMQCRNLVTIEKIISNENLVFKNNAFKDCTALTNITFEGVIGQSLDMSYSTALLVDSMKSIISCLKNYSGTSNEFTYKLSLSEDSWAALEADSTAPDGNTWKEYVGTLGWNT